MNNKILVLEQMFCKEISIFKYFGVTPFRVFWMKDLRRSLPLENYLRIYL
jgi:hypothetical protein